MSAPIDIIQNWTEITADMFIDVRSPAEFAKDHIPGAINMPVLNNEERAKVGRIYKQINAFQARRYGGALVAGNISQHILNYLQNKPAEFRPLIYCWRGGQRSHSFARICSDIGWRTYVLEGGYTSYRKNVLIGLETEAPHLKPILISGPTGTGKTRLLHYIKEGGAQILDLEALANHRGSLLGLTPGEKQPNQKYFETKLYHEIKLLDYNKYVFIEAESSKIGELQIPQSVFKIMKSAPLIEIEMSAENRAEFLIKEYLYLQSHPQALYKLFDAMVYRHGVKKIDQWRLLADKKDWQELANELIMSHYDPAYKSSSMRKDRKTDFILKLDSGHDDEFVKAARTIIQKYN